MWENKEQGKDVTTHEKGLKMKVEGREERRR